MHGNKQYGNGEHEVTELDDRHFLHSKNGEVR